MKLRHEATDSRKAFTLVELLMVICIISLLIGLFIPTMMMVRDHLMRLRCSTSLVRCHKVMMQYAANNSGWLPPAFFGHMQRTESNDKDLTLYAELKRYGASPEAFICPAYAGYGEKDDANWKTWTDKPNEETIQGSGKVYELSTVGYLFFDGYKPGSTSNRRLNNLAGEDGLGGCEFSDMRTWAISNDSRMNPPLAADALIWFNSGKGNDAEPEDGDSFAGFFHNTDNDGLESPPGGTKPGGGGNTVFLDGSVFWYDWEELVGGIKSVVITTGYGEQPAVDWGRRSSSPELGSFFCGLRPKTL